MLVYDPHASARVEWDDCHTAESYDGRHVPTRSPSTGEWFAVHAPTGTSFFPDEIPGMAERLDVEETAARLGRALSAGRSMREPGQPLVASGDTTARAEACHACGSDTVSHLEADAKAEGYDTLELLAAWVAMTGKPLAVILRPRPGDEPTEDLSESRRRLGEGEKGTTQLRAVLVLGSGGSGKTKVAQEMFGGSGMKNINPDTHLERLMKKAGEPLDKVGARYDLFSKARDLKNVEFDQYAKRRLGLVLDLTGWNYARVADPVEKLRKLGYSCYGVFVSTSLDTALRRNKARGDAGGRAVPDSYVKDAHDGAHANVDKFQSLFGPGRFFLIDNDADLSAGAWRQSVAPKLRKIGRKILADPIIEPAGLAFLASQAKGGSDAAAVGRSRPSVKMVGKKGSVPKLAVSFKPMIPPDRPLSPRATAYVAAGEPMIPKAKSGMFGPGVNFKAPEAKPRRRSQRESVNEEQQVMSVPVFAPASLSDGIEEDGGPANHAAARRIVPFIRSNPKLYAVYMATVVRPTRLYKRRGDYKPDKAPLLARHLVVQAGRAAAGNEGGKPWHATFNQKTRQAAERMVAHAARKDAASGQVDGTLPQKWRPGFSGYGKK